MQRFPVTRDGKRGSEVLIIDSSDVVKIEKLDDSQIMIHTHEDQYYFDFSFDNLEEWLFEDGFRLLNNDNIVNMNLVTDYDTSQEIVYLRKQNSEHAKMTSAARIHQEHLENVLQLNATSDPASAQHNTKKHDQLFEKIISETHNVRLLRSYATIRAVTERRRAEEKIIHMAYYDTLTNLPNRLHFDQRIRRDFTEAEQTNAKLAIIFFDLDRFNVINDTLGHKVGDQLLQALSIKLQSYVKDNDFVARFGDDQFTILLTNLAHHGEAAQFAEGIPELLKEPFILDNQELFVTASIGISCYPDDGTDAETLLKNADVAMHRSKEKGGNSYRYYHSGMNTHSRQRLTLENKLRKALERNEFDVYYQPFVDLSRDRISGMEALIRWFHPEEGMVPPAEFIPLAEETGLIVPIGNWVLRQACMQNKKWQTLGLHPLRVSVNISVSQFHQPQFVQIVEETLAETGLDPTLLCLEITENVAMTNVPYIIETLQKLRALGVYISIDDFGTGYSSFSYLKRFQVQTLKIDQSFISDITFDEENAAIVTALIAMAKQLKIKSLVEGVETQEQLDFLMQSGCNEVQGYLFSKPISAEAFEALLKESMKPLHN